MPENVVNAYWALVLASFSKGLMQKVLWGAANYALPHAFEMACTFHDNHHIGLYSKWIRRIFFHAGSPSHQQQWQQERILTCLLPSFSGTQLEKLKRQWMCDGPLLPLVSHCLLRDFFGLRLAYCVMVGDSCQLLTPWAMGYQAGGGRQQLQQTLASSGFKLARHGPLWSLWDPKALQSPQRASQMPPWSPQAPFIHTR